MKESVVISVRISVELQRRLAAEAERQDRSQNWVAAKAIETYLNRRQP